MCHILYCIARLRLPEESLVEKTTTLLHFRLNNESQSVLKQNDEEMKLKDIAVVLWAMARLEVHKKTTTNLPKLLMKKAEEMMNQTVIDSFDLDFGPANPSRDRINPGTEDEEDENELMNS